jgi:hypothetical protein
MHRRATSVLAFALIVSLAVPSTPAYAWGDNGHITIAKIADLNLTAEAKTAVADLLGPNVHIYDREIAMFADVFKFTSEGLHTKPWHFVDIPITESNYDPSRDCRGGDCVVVQIGEIKKALADTTKPKADRIFALKMLVHLVGDVHQPLHAAMRPDENGNTDEGGNKVPVHFLNRREGRLNLHKVWDDEILGENMRAADPERYATTLNGRITSLQRTQWSSSASPQQWANESHTQAQDHAYWHVPQISMITSHHPFNLDETYYAQASPVVDLQLSKAGIRLANLLNEVLK